MSRYLAPALAVFGAYQLLQGLVMVVAPRFFFDEVGPFGLYNDHYIRDTATWSLALGIVSLIAVSRASWRVPVLAFAVLQFGLHTINHIVDVNDARTLAIGIFDAVALGALTLVLVLLLRLSGEEEKKEASAR